MAKRNSKPVENAGTSNEVVTTVKTMESMTREELKARYDDNVAERQRLADENKQIHILWKTATSSEKKSSTEAKIAALQAKLAALQNPTVADAPVINDAAVEATAIAQ